jgi:hypothetical protein
MCTMIGSIIALISSIYPTVISSSIVLIVTWLPAFLGGQLLSIQAKKIIVQRTLQRINRALEYKQKGSTNGPDTPSILRTEMILETEEGSNNTPKLTKSPSKKDGLRYNFLDVVNNMSTEPDQIFNSPFDVEICARFIITSADPAATLVLHKVFELGLQEWKLSGLIEVRDLTILRIRSDISIDSVGQILICIRYSRSACFETHT